MAKKTHGARRHPLYKALYTAWCDMRRRCTNPKAWAYRYYGGKGVEVRWSSFEEFFHWAKANGWRRGLTIDRIDGDGHYGPTNCRFVDRREQSRNRQYVKLSAGKARLIRLMYEVGSGAYSQRELGEIFGVTKTQIRNVLQRRSWADVVEWPVTIEGGACG